MVYETPKSDVEVQQGFSPVFSQLLNFLLIGVLILTIFYWFYPYIGVHWLSDEELEILSYSGYNSLYAGYDLEYWIWGAYWVITTIGLIFRVKLFRPIYIIGLVLGTFMQLLWGFQVFTPFETFMGNLMSLSDGAIIILIYFTPACREFK